MALSSGRLRHRITIQEKINTQDPLTGAIVETWADKWVNISAEVKPLSAKEFIAANSVHSQVTARIVIRFLEGIDASMRIIFREKIYNIAGLLPDNVSGLEYITIPVSEVVNKG